MSSAESVINLLAQQDTQRIQQDQSAAKGGNAESVLSNLAFNKGEDAPPAAPAGTPTMSAAPKKGIVSRAVDKVSETEVPGTGVTLREAGKRAGEFADIAGNTALTLGGGPEGGVLGVLARGGRTAEEIAQASKFARLLDDAHEADKAGMLGKVLQHPIGKSLLKEALKGGAYALGGGTIYQVLKKLGVL